MILYHGTYCDFGQIDLQKSKPNKDFGRGFYLSADEAQARELAAVKALQYDSAEQVVQKYEVDEAELAKLRVLRFEDYSEEWAKFVLANRRNRSPEPVHDYDVVIGPIADDAVGLQLWRYESELIDLATLVAKLKYMKGVTFQYFFGTERAISLLKRLW